MVRLGAKLDSVDKRGYTALHIAIVEGTSEAVYELLQLGFLEKVDETNYFVHPFMICDYSNGVFYKNDSIICRRNSML